MKSVFGFTVVENANLLKGLELVGAVQQNDGYLHDKDSEEMILCSNCNTIIPLAYFGLFFATKKNDHLNTLERKFYCDSKTCTQKGFEAHARNFPVKVEVEVVGLD